MADSHSELRRLADSTPATFHDYKAWLSAVAECWASHCKTPLAGEQHALLCRCVRLVPVHAASARVLAYMPRGPQLIAYDQEEVLRFLVACAGECESIDKQLAAFRLRQERTAAGIDQEPTDQVQEPPDQAVAGDGVDESRTKATGGRPREWDDLWSMIQEEDKKVPKPKDQAIAGQYNKRYSRRAKATAKIVRDVRHRYRKLKRKQKHD